MAARTRYLVTYDIRDARRLRKVHQLVTDFGEQLQYSVYVCDLTQVELIRLRGALRKRMNLEVDAVSIFDLGPPHGRTALRVEHLGTRPQEPDTDEPAIW